ncbi:MAG: hypothetical protein JWM40_791 [Frankiales bacterium]|nr:hypothetical protein [Frankiales bacterium]
MLSKKSLLRVATAAVSLFLLVGCNGSFAGHGHLASKTGNGSAVLNFRIVCPSGSDTVSGSLDYLDRAAGVQMSGQATEVGSDSGGAITCDGDSSEGHYVGSYTSKFGAAGAFAMDLVASSSGCGGRALVTIAATSGVHTGYSNTQCLNGKVRSLNRGGDGPALPCVPFPICLIRP